MSVPPRSRWPQLPPATPEGAALTDLVLEVFRVNQRFLDAAADLAAGSGLSVAWWQVLGGVLDEPRTVADVGRLMGMSRQGVQRIADLLVRDGFAEYRPNPAHRRAQLLACTDAGYYAVRQISVRQHPWADRVGSVVGRAELEAAVEVLRKVVVALD